VLPVLYAVFGATGSTADDEVIPAGETDAEPEPAA
jgi:hypothetical protein